MNGAKVSLAVDTAAAEEAVERLRVATVALSEAMRETLRLSRELAQATAAFVEAMVPEDDL